MRKSIKFSPEVMERAVRMVAHNQTTKLTLLHSAMDENTPKSEEELDTLIKRAENGNLQAMFEWGHILFHGRYFEFKFIEQNKNKGQSLITQAANNGYIPAQAFLKRHQKEATTAQKSKRARETKEKIQNILSDIKLYAIIAALIILKLSLYKLLPWFDY